MKKPNKTAVNLSLSSEAVRKGKELKKLMKRPSLSNVVEVLIDEKTTTLKPAA